MDTHNTIKKDKPTLFLASSKVAQGYKKADFVHKPIVLSGSGCGNSCCCLTGFFSVDAINAISDRSELVDAVHTYQRGGKAPLVHKHGTCDVIAPYTLRILSGITATFCMYITRGCKTRKKTKTKVKSQEFVAPDCVQLPDRRRTNRICKQSHRH